MSYDKAKVSIDLDEYVELKRKSVLLDKGSKPWRLALLELTRHLTKSCPQSSISFANMSKHGIYIKAIHTPASKEMFDIQVGLIDEESDLLKSYNQY